MEKVCTSCNTEKPLSDFSVRKTGRIGDLVMPCKPCRVQAHRTKRRSNPDYYLQIERKSKFKNQYGITIEQYEEMLFSQGGGCGICATKTPSNRTKYFAVDHCHATGKVRGLLCTKCNRGLGLFNDRTDLLKSASNYLLGGLNAN
jgi:hypothetical protein